MGAPFPRGMLIPALSMQLKFKALKLTMNAALQRRFRSPFVFREEDPSRQVSPRLWDPEFWDAATPCPDPTGKIPVDSRRAGVTQAEHRGLEKLGAAVAGAELQSWNCRIPQGKLSQILGAAFPKEGVLSIPTVPFPAPSLPGIRSGFFSPPRSHLRSPSSRSHRFPSGSSWEAPSEVSCSWPCSSWRSGR